MTTPATFLDVALAPVNTGTELLAESLADRTDAEVRGDKAITWGANRFFLTIVAANLRNMGAKWCSQDIFTSSDYWSRVGDFLTSTVDAEGGGTALCGCLCVSAKGYYHIHAFLYSPVRLRYKAVHKLLGKCWVAPMRGSAKECRDYMEKTGAWEEKGEQILYRFGDWSILDSHQGERTDLLRFDDLALKPGFDFDAWVAVAIPPEASREISAYRTRYESLLRLQAKRRAAERRSLRVIYIEGAAGTGKTWRVYKSKGGLFEDSDVCQYDYASAFPLNAYVGQRVLHLDELRPGMIKMDRLLALLDPVARPVDVKNGRMISAWDVVVITSAFPLRDWFRSQDGDSEELLSRRAQLMRRITDHWIMQRDHSVLIDADFKAYQSLLLQVSNQQMDAREQESIYDDLVGELAQAHLLPDGVYPSFLLPPPASPSA